MNLLLTLSPLFKHFSIFAQDNRVAGIRLNSAMSALTDLDNEIQTINAVKTKTPLLFDIKGRQLRIEAVEGDKDNLELVLNHEVRCKTPQTVLFKAGLDAALLKEIKGNRLIFEGGPQFKVVPGESIYIRDPNLEIIGPIFTSKELLKIDKVKSSFDKYFLSYVEDQSDIDSFLELVGKDSEVWLKIESRRGLSFVANKFKKRSNLKLVAARGDLYVEIDRPHQIGKALKLIIEKDPEACVASRILLSVGEATIPNKIIDQLRFEMKPPVNFDRLKEICLKILSRSTDNSVPSCADFMELEALRGIGYKNYMLCDEICLDPKLLNSAIGAFDAFRND